MLFDLRGRGRRRTIKVIYVTLAFLMGGGLVFFGIGGDVSGGLVDAITERGAGGDTGEERFIEKERQALAATRARPTDASAWAELVRARVQLASFGERYDAATDTYTDEGKAKLREAKAAWEKYLSLDPPATDDHASLASRMVQAFIALGDAEAAARTQEIIAEVRESVGAYSTLAVLSYQAGQTRKGDLAAEKAVELAPEDQRESLRGQLESEKARGAAGALQEQAGG